MTGLEFLTEEHDADQAARALGARSVVHASAYGRAAFETEMVKIFARVWSFCCHESEIAEPGDFVTTTIGGSPIIVNRDRDGRVRAFYNTCRHRGARVVGAECGHARTLQCPYHRWTYGLDGRLLAVPGEEAYTSTTFNRGDFGLVPVPVDTVAGLVFCRPSRTGPSLQDFLGGGVIDLIEGVLQQGEFEVFEHRRRRHAVNWKLWPENLRDGYHVPFVHPRTLSPISPPGQYEILGNGHAIQRLGATQANLPDDVWHRLISDPLQGVQPAEGWIMTLFPDTIVFLRGNVFFVDRQDKLGCQETQLDCRVLGLVGDTEEQHRNRLQSWHTWYEDPISIEDDPVVNEQQIGLCTMGPQYSLIARGQDADSGYRGDDNRLRTFWDAWRLWMGTADNAWLPQRGIESTYSVPTETSLV